MTGSTNPTIPSGGTTAEGNINSSINQMNDVKTALANAEAKLQADVQIMMTLPTMVAYQFSMVVVGQTAQVQSDQQIAIPAQELNEMSATQSLLTFIQTMSQSFAGEASTYSGTPSTQENLNAEALYQSLTFLQTMFEGNSDPSSPYYNFCSSSTASTMLNSVDQMLNLMTNNGTVTSPSGMANNILTAEKSYQENPSGSPYAAAIGEWNSDINTMENLFGQLSSTVQGQIKVAVSQIEQLYGNMESMIQNQNTLNMQEIQNENNN